MAYDDQVAAWGADEKTRETFNVDRAFNTLMTLSAAAYAWQLYGWIAGLAVLVGLWIARGITANAILYWRLAKAVAQDQEPDPASILKWTSRSRWAWVILAFVVLAISAAEVCTGTVCKSIWE